MRPTVERYRRYLTLLFGAGTVVGLVFSPPTISIGLIGLFLLGVFDPLSGINPRWRADTPKMLRSPVFWGLTGIYLLLIFGIWQTEDWSYYLQRLRIKIPLLALPLAWAGLPRFSRVERAWITGGTALFLLGVLGVVLVNYGLHFTEINGLIERGQAVPVPRNHIRFSLLVAVATLLAVGAYRLSGQKWWLCVAAALFVGQHFLAVRSGLAGAYGGAGTLVLWWGWKGNAKLAAVALLGLICLPLLAYVLVPSFRTKVQYARYELFHRDTSVDTAEYSDAGRFTSWRVGLDVWRENPVFGVGPGNLLRATDARYAEILPGSQGKRPHNQFISALAGSGLFGGVITLVCFLLLLLHGLRLKLAIFTAVWVVFFLSCLVENTLENTVGVSTFAFFTLLLGYCVGAAGATPSPGPTPLPSPPDLCETGV